MSQLQTILKYKVPSGESRRFNCPFCRGRNTLSITNHNGLIEWNCFRNSCDAKGKHGKGLSIEDAKSRVGNLVVQPKKQVVLAPMPSLLFPIDNHSDIINYLVVNNCIKAYENGLVDIKYDPSSDRIMFPVLSPISGTTTGYIGRYYQEPRPRKISKWLKYGDCTSLFACGSGEIAVLVEDACSACAVSGLTGHVGVSILGTALSAVHKTELLAFDKIFVALDPDASAKGLFLTKRIPNSKLVLIPDDLKNYNPQQIQTILYKGNDK